MRKIWVLVLIISSFQFVNVLDAASRWQKLNFLLPEPLCSMKEDTQNILQITEWRDIRPQPTDVEIDAVTDQEVIDSELDNQAGKSFSASKRDRLLFELNFDRENRLRVLEGANILTREQYKTGLKNIYKTL